MLRPTAVLAAWMLALPTTGMTQDAEQARNAATLEAMRKLDFLVGQWRGNSTMQMGPGEPHAAVGTETVTRKVGGYALLVEGRFTDAASDRIVHDALAVISYDPDAREYRFRTYLANGRGGEHVGRFEGDAFVWGFTTPQGQIRYTIRLTPEGKWNEIGEFSPDATTWRPFFQMTLEKTGTN